MTEEKTLTEELAILKDQEEKLQFTHFTHRDVWELGTQIVEEAMRLELPIAISIRLFSGITAFQYFCKGSSLNNDAWMKRKEMTVRDMEMSSLRMFTEFAIAGKTMEDKLLDRYTYACCGGGFPVRVKNAGVIGVILVSGLPHKEDHSFIVRCLKSYLGVEAAPEL
ncbi:MAG: heme-degrading domain-containing protein [Flexilinea sp.]